ncbi:FecR family protein [Legionella cincinnatiensis]|uniref:FecR protein n=1 Tax=Legionella cincinnatiensis TaxID=28085 RepID=A0A378IEE7_9GAMM|nr:FecR family protein [Legionella cincinnatiensis]KTC92099.1 FecR protein [Legionella cincinnatiensis]STX33598.1 FecR protein [Legionella cincinnatiensis]
MKKLIVINVLLYSINVVAQPVAKVLNVTNTAIAKKGNIQRILSPGSPIHIGESIITKANAKIDIQYENGTLVAVQKNSNYETVAYKPKAELKLKAKLNTGAIEYKSTGKKKGLIQTPVVALAIEGTQFKLIATPQKTYIQVTEGMVKSGNELLGPSQKFASGSFDKNQKFTPGSIPWNTYSSLGATNMTVPTQNQTVMLSNEINMDLVANMSTSAAVDSLVTMPPTELAELIIGCP